MSEGGSGTGNDIRKKQNLPSNNEKRRKHFLSQTSRESFSFEKDRVYSFDFFNPYLDFGKFALKLPGFSIKVIKYIDDKSHTLRYVFKNRQTGDVYLCVNFNLLWGEKLEKVIKEDEGQVKALAGAEMNGTGGSEEKEALKQSGLEMGSNPHAANQSVAKTDDSTQPKRQRDMGAESNAQSGTTGGAKTELNVNLEERIASNGTDSSNPGLRDKPDWLREQAQRMSISDTLNQTATADKQYGKAGVLDDLD